MKLDISHLDHWRRARAVAAMERLVAALREMEEDTTDLEFRKMLKWAKATLEEWR